MSKIIIENRSEKIADAEAVKVRNTKQGPCGSFCFKYWIGSGCSDCIIDLNKRSDRFVIVDEN